MLDPDLAHEKLMLDCMAHLQEVVDILDEADFVLTAKEWQKCFTFAKRFVDGYSKLNQWSENEGKMLFHKVYKFHQFQHMMENAKWLNPRCHWCFSNEDFVGKISLLTYSIASGVKAVRLSYKVAPKYRVLLHMLLTRKDFANTVPEFSLDLHL